ncbi:uroporphyrin-III methyltransferase [Lysinibacillus pakistanensis]|uniref:uroporphyrin-III methyltransferase n=1 Tax=Lysinibacillus TaxID=400634 RepID=UPI00257B1BCA|nr:MULTISPECIES: uroporphyrin-III methyltransferase [Lysinibacillus]
MPFFGGYPGGGFWPFGAPFFGGFLGSFLGSQFRPYPPFYPRPFPPGPYFRPGRPFPPRYRRPF